MNPTNEQNLIFKHTSASEWLFDLFQMRKKANPRISLRAFAKKLDISHTVIVRFFQNKSKLSDTSLSKVVKNLELTPLQAEYLHHISGKNVNPKKLDELRTRASVKPVSISDVADILDLNTIALLQIVYNSQTEAFDAAKAARKLALTVEQTELLLQQLKHHDLVRFDYEGKVTGTGNRIVLSSPNAQKALTNFYKSALSKASETLDSHAATERVIGSETIAFDPQDLDEANRVIDDCLNRLVALSRRAKNPSEIYHCNTIFFRLTHKDA